LEELASRKSFRKRKAANIKLTAAEKKMQKLLGTEAKKKPKNFNE
jgi:exonuclease VII small subunit